MILECTEYMRELSDANATLSQEQVESSLHEIKENHPISKGVKIGVAKRPRKLLKIAAAVAAILIISFSTLTVAAKMNGYSNALEFVVENIEKILKLESGETIEKDGITLIKGDKSVAYDSIEELISTEGYDILYPANLPNNIQVTKVALSKVNDDYMIFTFLFNDMNLSIFISNNFEISQEDLLTYELFETRETIFYIKAFSNGTYQAIGYYKNFEYRITYTNHDDLKMILENKTPKHFSKEDAKIAIDVLEEIKNENARSENEKLYNSQMTFWCKLVIDGFRV